MNEWKETDIGKIPFDWETKEIGDLLVDKGISVGVMYPGEFTIDGVPLVRAGDIKNGKIDKKIQYRISKTTNELHKRTILNGDELLVVLVGQPGVGVVVNEYFKGWNVARAVGVLKFIDKSERQFVTYSLKHTGVKSLLLASCNTTVQPTLNLAELKEVLIPWPSKIIRDSITSILSSLDNKIDLLHRQNATLEKMAETLFRQWFVEEAKEEWDSDKLGKVFDIGIGRTPPRKEHHWFSGNPSDVKWVSIKDMGTSGVYISNVSEYLTQDAVKRFSIPIIPENTVMLSFKMTIGRLAISTENMLSNEAIAHFKVKKDSRLFSEFLYIYLKTYQWEQLGSTSSIVEAINSQMIKEMEIFIPEEKMINAFKEIIEPYFKKIKSNQTQIRTLTTLRDTLLPKLMSGEVMVKL